MIIADNTVSSAGKAFFQLEFGGMYWVESGTQDVGGRGYGCAPDRNETYLKCLRGQSPFSWSIPVARDTASPNLPMCSKSKTACSASTGNRKHNPKAIDRAQNQVTVIEKDRSHASADQDRIGIFVRPTA